MNPSISHCPECGYCLTGLPARHRCPECGLAYDEHTRVWRPRHRRALYWAVLGSAFIVYFQLFVFFLHTVRTGLRGWVDGMMGVVIALGLFTLIRKLYRVFVANRRGQFAAVTPGGLMVRSLGDTVTVPWAHIREITHWVSPTSYLDIIVDDDTLRKSLGMLFSREKNVAGIHQIVVRAERDAFVSAVTEAIRRNRNEADSAQTSK